MLIHLGEISPHRDSQLGHVDELQRVGCVAHLYITCVLLVEAPGPGAQWVCIPDW